MGAAKAARREELSDGTEVDDKTKLESLRRRRRTNGGREVK